MEGSDLGDNFEDEQEKKEYVKKEYYARPLGFDSCGCCLIQDVAHKRQQQ